MNEMKKKKWNKFSNFIEPEEYDDESRHTNIINYRKVSLLINKRMNGTERERNDENNKKLSGRKEKQISFLSTITRECIIWQSEWVRKMMIKRNFLNRQWEGDEKLLIADEKDGECEENVRKFSAVAFLYNYFSILWKPQTSVAHRAEKWTRDVKLDSLIKKWFTSKFSPMDYDNEEKGGGGEATRKSNWLQ